MITTKQLKGQTITSLVDHNLHSAGSYKVATRGWKMEVYPIGNTGYAIAMRFAAAGNHMNVVYKNQNGEWQLVGDDVSLCHMIRGTLPFAYVDIFVTDQTNINLWIAAQIIRFSPRNAAQDLEACGVPE